MLLKGKGRILFERPEFYLVEKWNLNECVKVPRKTVDMTAWLDVPWGIDRMFSKMLVSPE